MGNLTLQIDDEVLKRARIRALEQGTSVNALVREYLAAVGGVDAALATRQRVVDLAARTDASSGTGGRTWTRDELHDR